MVVTKPESVNDPRAKTLNDDVGAVHEARERIAAFFAFEINLDRATAAVPHGVTVVGAKWVATGRLDLDDIGTVLGQHEDAQWSGDAP